MSYNIAIDGPAGAGKSTVAKKVAKRLCFIYVDTGAMYRGMALHFIRAKIAADDQAGIENACESAVVSIDYAGKEQQIMLNGENVTTLLRQEAVGDMASKSSIYPKVRRKMLTLQRELAAKADVVMDGRDIGTVILPEADLKIYLTADVKERSMRRFRELEKKGIPCTYENIVKEITKRDYRDMNRETAPLQQAQDAYLIDSTNMNADQVVGQILKIFEEKCKVPV